VKTMVKSESNVTKNTFDMIIARNAGIMHKQTCLLNSKRNFRTCDSKILESIGKTTIKRSIKKELPVEESLEVGSSINPNILCC
jgi:hypothetical protein